MHTVEGTLQEIKASDKPTILVFNMSDQWIQETPTTSLKTLQKRYQTGYSQQVVFIAAKENQHINT